MDIEEREETGFGGRHIVPGSCRVGRADCDGDPSTICEAETLRDPCHCHGCGQTCAPGQFCVAGLCQGRQDPLVQTGPPAPASCGSR